MSGPIPPVSTARRQVLSPYAFGVVIVSLYMALPPAANADDDHWNGGFSDSWNIENNWDQIGFPFGVKRVPQDFDRAILATPANDVVRLYADSEPINGLEISNGIDLHTNGHTLTVDDGGAAEVIITGANARLIVEQHAAGANVTAFDADMVRVAGGRFEVFGKAQIDGGLDVRNAGTVTVNGTTTAGQLTVDRFTLGSAFISSGELTVSGPGARFYTIGAGSNTVGSLGSGTLTLSDQAIADFAGDLRVGGVFGTAQLTVASGSKIDAESILIGGSTGTTSARIDIAGSNSNIRQSATATLTVGLGAGNGTASLRIWDRGLLYAGSGLTTIDETGTVELITSGAGGGTLLPLGDVLVNGGTLIESDRSNFSIAAGRHLTVQNGGGVFLNNHLMVDGGSAVSVTDGNFFAAPYDPFDDGVALTVGDMGQGSALFTGPQTDFNIDGSLLISARGGTGSVTVSDQADGSFRFLRMAAFSWPNAQAELNITSGATVSLFGDSQIAGNGAQAHAEVNIDGTGSSLTAGGNASFFVGTNGFPSGGSARLDVTNGGRLELEQGAGRFANGLTGIVNINGGSLVTAGSGGIDNEGLFQITGASAAVLLSNGGDFNNNGGTVSGAGKIHLGGGTFYNNGGHVAPGNSAGDFEIIAGDFVADVDAVLDIELGGLGRGQFDRLLVGGNAALDGVLSIVLVDGFLPRLSDSFVFLYAAVITGGFDTIMCAACGGRQFEIHIGAGTATLTVTAVPLPPAVYLFGAALAALGVGARRRCGARSV